MLTILKSLVQPKLDYCSQLWSPATVCDINRLELVQKCFMKKMNSFEDLSYWELLKELRLYSLQRRRERYRIIYLWSVLECLVPNPKPSQLYGRFHQRHGRFCHVPVIKKTLYVKVLCNHHLLFKVVSFSTASPKKFVICRVAVKTYSRTVLKTLN